VTDWLYDLLQFCIVKATHSTQKCDKLPVELDILTSVPYHTEVVEMY